MGIPSLDAHRRKLIKKRGDEMLRKRMFIVVVVISLVLTTGLSTFSLNSNIIYSDIEDHWAQHMIEEFTQRGYLVGYSDGTFRPDYPITRAEAGAFVSRLGFPELYPEIVYSDLMEGTWYYNHVIAATKTGFVHGYPDVTYRPDIFILREEATKLASHFWGEVDMAGYELAFSDKGSISDWSFNHLEKLCKMTLLDGYPDNTIRPKANLTRAEFVKLFYLILIEPKYANIIVRAVDSNNESYDLVEPKVFSYEIGSEITLSSPDISYPWQLLGDITKTLMVEGETEILFKYYYYTPPANVGGVTQTTYSLSLSTIPSMETATLTGAGIYLANTTVPVSAPEVEGYSFTGWYRQVGEGSTLISNNRSFNYTMPSSNTLLVAHYEEDVQKYNLNINFEPEEGGSVTGAGSYAPGTVVNVNAIPNEGYHFNKWRILDDGDYNEYSTSLPLSFTMPAWDVTLQAAFNLTTTGDCVVPTLIAHSNYNVDNIMTLTYVEDDNEYDIWRNNIRKVVIYRLGEGTEKLGEVNLPYDGIDLSSPGSIKLDPSKVELIQKANENYSIEIVGELGCTTSVEQYINAGAVYYLEYVPLRSTYDFDLVIYPGTLATYEETPFVTTRIEVGLYDKYKNVCRTGPSSSSYVYAYAGGDDPGWVLTTYIWDGKDSDGKDILKNQGFSVVGSWGYADVAYLHRSTTDQSKLGAGSYITFKVYLPGELHDATGEYVTLDTSTFTIPLVN